MILIRLLGNNHKNAIIKYKKYHRIYNVDKTKFKVHWHELLYDLIFIVLIEKILKIFANSSYNLNIGFIIMILSILIVVIWIWHRRILQTNQIYILENKLNIEIPQYKFLTYFEILLLLILFYQLEHSASPFFYICIISISIIFEALSMNVLKNQLLRHYRYKSDEIYKAITTFWEIRFNTINMEHILERFGVLTILFLGETLREIFMLDENWLIITLFCIIIFTIFDANTRIIHAIEHKTLKHSKVDYTTTTGYFKRTLIILLLIMMSISYAHYNHIKYPIDLIILLIINRIHQKYTLFKLKQIWLNPYEVACFLYFIFILIYILHFANYTILTAIIISIFCVLKLKKDAYYNRLTNF